MNIRLLCLLCIAKSWSLVYRSSTVCVCVWETVRVCLILCDLENQKWGGLGPRWALTPQKRKLKQTTPSPFQLSRIQERIVDGIATRYGLNGPRIESRWVEIFRTRPDRPRGPPSLLYNGWRVSFPGVKRQGRGVNHPPHLAPRLKKV